MRMAVTIASNQQVVVSLLNSRDFFDAADLYASFALFNSGQSADDEIARPEPWVPAQRAVLLFAGMAELGDWNIVGGTSSK